MKKLYLTIVSLALLGLIGIVYARTYPTTGGRPITIHKPVADSSDLSILRSIYQEFADPQNHTGCTVEFTAATVFRNIEGKFDTTAVRCRYAASRTRMQLLTDSLSVYSDSVRMVAVLPHQRELYITSLDDLNYKDLKRRMVGIALEAMFDNGKVVESGAVQSSRERYASGTGAVSADHKVVIEPGIEIVKRIAAHRITIIFNREERVLREVLIEFAPDVRTQSTRIRYDEFHWNKLPESFSMPLLAGFFDAEGKLVSRYRGYAVDDRRYHNASGQ